MRFTMRMTSTSQRMARAIPVLLIVLLPLGATAGAADEETPLEDPAVVATVNGEELFAEQVAANLGRLHSSADSGTGVGYDAERLMFRVINDALIAQEGRALGLAEEEEIRKKVQNHRQRLAKAELERREIAAKAVSTDEEVRRLFDSQYQRVTFRVVTAYELPEAQGLRLELEEGADITALAGEKSVDPYRIKEGLVNDIERIDLQFEIADLIFSLEPGAIGGPVRTNLGWSVVQVESFQSPAAERFEQVEASLRALVRQRKANQARRDLAAALTKAYEIAIDQEVVASIEPERLPDDRLIPTDPEPGVVLVTIEGKEVILAKDYTQALTLRWSGVRNIEAARATAPIVLRRLIDSQLLLHEALSRGYDRLPRTERAVHAFESDLVLRKYLGEVVAASIEVSPDEMQAYYDQHRDELHRPPRVRLGQITVATEEEALDAASQLRGGAELAWLAKQRSLDGFRDQGGDRGWYVPQVGTSDFNAELFAAEIGNVLDPFGALDNWIVLMVTDRQDQGVFSLNEVSGNVRDKVFADKLRQEIDKLVKVLRERSQIEIFEDTLAQLQITGSQESATSEGDSSGHGH